MNKSAVRRALTTLKKNGVMEEINLQGVSSTARLVISISIPAELIQPKKRVYIRKTKTK